MNDKEKRVEELLEHLLKVEKQIKESVISVATDFEDAFNCLADAEESFVKEILIGIFIAIKEEWEPLIEASKLKLPNDYMFLEAQSDIILAYVFCARLVVKKSPKNMGDLFKKLKCFKNSVEALFMNSHNAGDTIDELTEILKRRGNYNAYICDN